MFEGHYYCFPPVTHLDKTGLTLIRPLFYVNEWEIRGYSYKNNLPVSNNPCPADQKTKRETVKKYIKDSETFFPDIRKNLMSALTDFYEKNQ